MKTAVVSRFEFYPLTKNIILSSRNAAFANLMAPNFQKRELLFPLFGIDLELWHIEQSFCRKSDGTDFRLKSVPKPLLRSWRGTVKAKIMVGVLLVVLGAGFGVARQFSGGDPTPPCLPDTPCIPR
jgi:hypothetical protein